MNASTAAARPAPGSPFGLETDTAYLQWREQKLSAHPACVDDLVVEVRDLERLLANDTPYIFRVRLESGMGIVCNNVLHNRSGFASISDDMRLLYRARYYDRM